ncbi:MAG TPA: hypothetical protein VFT29_06655 [Gemmatimonadaceae bacterium]|nr:hypothetical protein [Gemmatimonadaceae bacterium]
MPRKPNYGFEKRQKELDRQKKKEAKVQARRDKAAAEKQPQADDAGDASQDPGAPSPQD